jgi:hypothetical protein
VKGRSGSIEGSGYGLRVASLDADISVPRLLEDQLGVGARPAAAENHHHLVGNPNGRERRCRRSFQIFPTRVAI